MKGGVIGIKGILVDVLHYVPGETQRFQNAISNWCTVPEDLRKAHLTRRSEWFASRALLFQLLQRQGISARLSMQTDHGYPELYDDKSGILSSVHVSWAHTENFVAVALAPSSIGVDAERLDRSLDRVVERIATPEEMERAQGLVIDGLPIPAPLALWCAKEAAAKATGLGMRWGLKNFEWLGKSGPCSGIRIHQPGPRRLTDPAVGFFVREGTLVALCTERAHLFEPPTFS